jgi:CheY-like chemotaxis protein
MKQRPLVLLIDDDPNVRDIFQDILDHFDIELQVAWDYASSMQILSTYQPSVILIDIFLPDTDGYKLLETIRQSPTLKHCPVIATTGYYTTDSPNTFKQRGFDHYLLKPYDPEQVIKVLREIGGSLIP